MPLQSGLEIKGFCTDKNLSIANKKIIDLVFANFIGSK